MDQNQISNAQSENAEMHNFFQGGHAADVSFSFAFSLHRSLCEMEWISGKKILEVMA